MEEFKLFIESLSQSQVYASIGILVSMLVSILARSWFHFAFVATLPKIINFIPMPYRIPAFLVFEVIYNISLFMDKIVSAFIPGKHHELWRTVSYRLGAWQAEGDKRATFICKTFLHPFDKYHCKRAYESNEGGEYLFVWVRALDLV